MRHSIVWVQRQRVLLGVKYAQKDEWVGKNLIELHLRKKYGINVVALKKNGKKKVTIPTVFTASPGVLEAFNKTEYAERLKNIGVITSYICPLMYMNNPLCKKMPVITSSNKLRTYTSARYYTDAEILNAITGGNA